MRFAGKTLMFVAWSAAVIGGFCIAFHYAWSPAATREAAAGWPRCPELSRDARLPTLVMFVHPQCPCTRASLTELARLLTRCHGEVAARLVFVRPAGVEDGWEQTDLLHTAYELPGVEVVVDSTGALVEAFHAQVSGETYLYDKQGRLLFHGGITASRGHIGENTGADAVIEFIERGAPSATKPKSTGAPCWINERANSWELHEYG